MVDELQSLNTVNEYATSKSAVSGLIYIVTQREPFLAVN